MTENDTPTFFTGVKYGKKIKVDLEDVKIPEEPPICKLNDDCLIKIFNHLSPQDRILVEQGRYINNLFLNFNKDCLAYENLCLNSGCDSI